MSAPGIYPRARERQTKVFFELSKRLERRYLPARPFPGDVTVVRGDGSPRNTGYPTDLGWGKWVRGTVTVLDVSSDHRGVIREPVVSTVGAFIRDAWSD